MINNLAPRPFPSGKGNQIKRRRCDTYNGWWFEEGSYTKGSFVPSKIVLSTALPAPYDLRRV